MQIIKFSLLSNEKSPNRLSKWLQINIEKGKKGVLRYWQEKAHKTVMHYR